MTVIAVVSPKGGSGKTTVAVNLAVSLGRHERVCLVDLDVQFGDVEYALRVHPVHRMNDAVKKIMADPGFDPGVLLASYSPEVGVLCAPSNPVDADVVDVVGAMKVIDALVATNQPVVIDTAAGVNEFTLGALERASHYVLVTGTDVASVQAAHKLIETMEELRFDLQRMRLVVNRATVRTGLTVADVEAVLGMRAALRIPEDPAVSASMNAGSPIAAGDGDAPLAQMFHRFVDDMSGVSAPPKRQSLWGKVF